MVRDRESNPKVAVLLKNRGVATPELMAKVLTGCAVHDDVVGQLDVYPDGEPSVDHPFRLKVVDSEVGNRLSDCLTHVNHCKCFHRSSARGLRRFARLLHTYKMPESDELLTLGEAAALARVTTQALHYRLRHDQLTDQWPKKTGPPPNAKRISRAQLIKLYPHAAQAPTSVMPERQSADPDFIRRLDRMEAMLEALMQGRDDAAQIMKARVDEQRERLDEERKTARDARRERDSAVDDARNAQVELVDAQGDLEAFSDALTQLLQPGMPPRDKPKS